MHARNRRRADDCGDTAPLQVRAAEDGEMNEDGDVQKARELPGVSA
jgi:hypothetical protein